MNKLGASTIETFGVACRLHSHFTENKTWEFCRKRSWVKKSSGLEGDRMMMGIQVEYPPQYFSIHHFSNYIVMSNSYIFFRLKRIVV